MSGGSGVRGSLPEWTERAVERIGQGGPPVLLVGLTGGIATGKSTVGGMLRELGVAVIDADLIVHALLGPGGAAVEPVIERFGATMRDDAGGIDRKALGALVFRDDASRSELEAIVHPMVIDESERRFHEIARAGSTTMVVYDAALLVETGRHERFDRLVVVACERETQLQRLMDHADLSADEAGARIRAQMPVEQKAALADYVIDNSGPWHRTRREVEALHRSLEADTATLEAALAAVS